MCFNANTKSRENSRQGEDTKFCWVYCINQPHCRHHFIHYSFKLGHWVMPVPAWNIELGLAIYNLQCNIYRIVARTEMCHISTATALDFTLLVQSSCARFNVQIINIYTFTEILFANVFKYFKTRLWITEQTLRNILNLMYCSGQIFLSILKSFDSIKYSILSLCLFQYSIEIKWYICRDLHLNFI